MSGNAASSFEKIKEMRLELLREATPLFDSDRAGAILKLYSRKLDRDFVETALKSERRKARRDLIKRLRNLKGILVVIIETE